MADTIINMNTNSNTLLLTIVTEESLSGLIEEEIIVLGAKGFTSTSVSGKGSSGLRNNHWDGMNVRIESIVTESVCEKILSHLQEKYFERYAVIAFYHPVNLIRTSHFK